MEEDLPTKKVKSIKKLQKSVDEADKVYKKAEVKEGKLDECARILQQKLTEALEKQEKLAPVHEQAKKN